MGFQLFGQTGPVLAVLKKYLGRLRAVFEDVLFPCYQGQNFFNIVASGQKSCMIAILYKKELQCFLYLILIFDSKLVYQVLVCFRMSYQQGQKSFFLISLFIIFANIQNQECFIIPLSVPHNPFLEIVLDQASKLAYDIRNLPSPR